MIKLADNVPTYCCKRFTIKVPIYVKMKMWNKQFAFLLLLNLLSLVFGEMDAETVYVSLSRRIDDLYFEARTIRHNVGTMEEHSKTVEESVHKLMSAIQQCTENSESVVPGQEAVEDLKESIHFQALALWKTMTKEKTLLRESVKQLNTNFYELREHMQKQMSDFFETVTKQLLAANTSIESTSTEVRKVEEKCSESEDLRIEELKRDLKAEIDQNYLELKSILAKAQNGGWTSWAAWGQCSRTCGTGLQNRGRTCSNPEPKYGGRYCDGVPSEYQVCTPADCTIMSDCLELLNAGNTISGVYTIRLWKSKETVEVYCDMDTDGGGWTVFQNRFNGSVDFYRSFVEYESGFGRPDGEFWLGLSYVQELTDRVNGASELRLDVSTADGDTTYDVYQNFYLSGGNNYTLNIGPCKGTPCDRGLSYNRGRSFSTYDRDVDGFSQLNCAIERQGGWWYHSCTNVNLNGRYATPGQDIGLSGMYFYDFKGTQSLKTSKMMFRRTS